MRRVLLTRLAARDLDAIKFHLLGQATPRIVRQVITEIRRAINVIAREPGLGHVRPDLTDRPVRFWSVYSFLIVYDPELRPVQILRILHGSRDIESIIN